jgi:putative cardiolipin synthase
LKRLRENIAREPYPHPLNEDVAKLRSQLDDIVVGGIWARGQVVWDDPASINDPSLRTMRRLLVNRLERLQTELLVESAYFIPLGPGVEILKGLVSRGRPDPGAHELACLQRRARSLCRLLEGPWPVARVRSGALRGATASGTVSTGNRVHRLPAGLHTKAMVFDRKDVFVGSFNLDPRSSLINTEAGLYVESPELAAMVAEYMEEGCSRPPEAIACCWTSAARCIG